MGHIVDRRFRTLKVHTILPGDMKHRETDTTHTDQCACPAGTIMIPDDIWLRLEKKLGGRKPLLDLLGITEYDKEI